MQRILQDKRFVLALSFIALISLILLAGSLKTMSFRPSEAFGSSRESDLGTGINLKELITNAAEVPLWKQLAFWSILFLLVVLIASLLSPELRKQLIYTFIRVALFVLVFLYIVKRNPKLFAGLLERLPAITNLSLNPQAVEAPAPVFQPPQPPNWLTYVIALAVVFLSILFIWWMNRVIGRIREMNPVQEPLFEIAKVARKSLNDLRSGQDVDNSIIECYIRMSDAVNQKRGLSRADAMTPSEFASHLTRAGLPKDAVASLTHLFEAVRYGGLKAGQAEVNEAIRSLTSILRFCGETV